LLVFFVFALIAVVVVRLFETRQGWQRSNAASDEAMRQTTWR
jgi:hypothetical protein